MIKISSKACITKVPKFENLFIQVFKYIKIFHKYFKI